MPDAAAPGTAWGVLRRVVVRQRGLLWRTYPLICLWQLGEAMVPIVIGVVIDEGIAAGSLRGLLWSLALLVGVFAIFSLSYRFGGRMGARAIEEEAHSMRLEICRHALHPAGVDSRQTPGELLALATGDTKLIATIVRPIGFALASALTLVVVAVYLVRVDVAIAALILLGVPSVVAITQLLTPLVARRTDAQQASIARASGVATDLVHGLRPLKGIHGEDEASRRYRRVSATARDASIETARAWGYLGGMTVGLSGLYLAAVAALAGVQTLQGDLSIGQLIAIVGLAQFLAEPINALGDLSAQGASSYAAAGRVARFLSSGTRLTDGDARPTGAELELADVHAGPLRGLDLAVGRGRCVAVVTSDGESADALVDVLNGELVPDRGDVRLGGAPLVAIGLRERRSLVLVHPHETDVFDGTVRSVVDPAGELDDDAVEAALLAAGAEDLYARHPDGLDRPVREGGSTLSGGQRQRLALARAYAAGNDVLVLHDPTSALDSVTERRVASGLRSMRGDRGASTLVLTSSPALLAEADEILFVHDGVVSASGTHGELLSDDAYRRVVLR